MIRIVIEPF